MAIGPTHRSDTTTSSPTAPATVASLPPSKPAVVVFTATASQPRQPAASNSSASTTTSTAARPSAPSTAAPRPDEAAGYSKAPPAERASPAVRALLFVPRGLAFIIFLPIRGVLYAFDAGQLRARFESIFFNRERTFGAFPILRIETPFGVSAGGTVVHRDLTGKGGPRLSLTAAFGGRLTSGVDLRLDTGGLLGDRNRVELRFTYDGQPDVRFHGVGNTSNLVAPSTLNSRLDPYDSSVSVESATFRDRVVLDLTPIHQLDERVELRTRLAWIWQDISERDIESTPVNVGDVYRVDELRYFDDPFNTLVLEIDIRYDSLHVTNPVLPPSTQSSGWFARAFIAANQVLARPDSFFFRGGVDLRRHVDLFAGTRVLVLRLYGEAVGAPVESVPVLELPELGGPFDLRGHRRGRFRDQALWLASAEYRFPVISVLSGFLFVDVGRVFSRPSQVFDAPQLGFGGGLEISERTTRLVRLQVAGSRLGNVLFNLEIGLDLAGPDRLRRRW